jgi:nucleoside-diphosphate-sugar epimerase
MMSVFSIREEALKIEFVERFKHKRDKRKLVARTMRHYLNTSMAKYFITGGAGFLGINLIRFLLAKAQSIVSYDIEKDFNYPERDNPDVSIVTGDIRDYDALAAAVRGCDVVVHAAAALPLYSKEDIYSTDVEGTRNVLRAAEAAGIKRVVQISSTAVYGVPDHHPLYETDRLIGVGPYGEAKIAAEKVCEEFRAKGLVVPVIRPKSFIGPERLGVFALFYDWAADGHGFPMIGSGANRYQLLDVADLCEAIWLCATLPAEKANDTFNIGAKEYTTMKEDYQAVLDEAGFGKKISGFPATPVIWALRILEALHLSPLYKWVYETASKDSFVSIEKAEKTLGYTPRFSNKDALVRNYKWYLENRSKFAGASGVSHRVPWKQGILSIVKKFF